ncbi:MAG TPA: hypothetical protein VMZ91_05890, partial [Candidatus Paceibacterota bacterium]|nr:hypothetical protein [Candidatus Paceibacterota bacterium]
MKSKQYWIILDRLADVILKHVKGCIVDIGVGHSTYVLAAHAKKLKIKQYSVDNNKYRCDNLKKNITHDNHFIYNQKSYNFMKTFDDIPALVFIDAN